MVNKWNLKYTKAAIDDSLRLKKSGLKEKAEKLLEIIELDPYKNPPKFEKLVGLEDTYSRRINIQHRLVYQVLKSKKVIKILSMFGHY